MIFFGFVIFSYVFPFLAQTLRGAMLDFKYLASHLTLWTWSTLLTNILIAIYDTTETLQD